MIPDVVTAIEVKIHAILRHVEADTAPIKLKMEKVDFTNGALLESGSRESKLVLTSEAVARRLLRKIPEIGECQISVERLLKYSEEYGRPPKDQIRVVPYVNQAGSSNINVAIVSGTPAIGIESPRSENLGKENESACINTMIDAAKHILLLASTIGSAE